jgi:hypothetical protein
MRTCSRCKESKEDSAFYRHKRYGKGQFSSRCKDCAKEASGFVYSLHIKRTYGITIDQYNAMLEAQGGGCWICSRPPKKRRLCVDHNHKTGEIRGLLCHLCNRGLAYYRDNPELFQRAALYLTKDKGEN